MLAFKALEGLWGCLLTGSENIIKFRQSEYRKLETISVSISFDLKTVEKITANNMSSLLINKAIG